DGDVDPDDALTVNVDPQASLDVFVTGEVSGGDDMTLGSSAHPGACRVYVAGGAMTTGGDLTVHCNVYAPNVTIAVPQTSYGSFYGGALFSGELVTVHYDRSVGGPTCTPAACDDGNVCTVDACNADGTCA